MNSMRVHSGNTPVTYQSWAPLVFWPSLAVQATNAREKNRREHSDEIDKQGRLSLSTATHKLPNKEECKCFSWLPHIRSKRAWPHRLLCSKKSRKSNDRMLDAPPIISDYKRDFFWRWILLACKVHAHGAPRPHTPPSFQIFGLIFILAVWEEGTTAETKL